MWAQDDPIAPNAQERQALVDPAREVGSSSTRPSATGGTPGETGVDTLRLLFETDRYLPEGIHDVDGWRAGSIPALGLTWAEGHPVDGRLANASEVRQAGEAVRGVLDGTVGVRRDRGAARVDVTTTRRFLAPAEARAFVAGMAALELPRCESIRRGTPVHSIAWAHQRGRRLLARCYDKGLERGGEAFEFVRLEDQRRFASGARPGIDEVSDPEWQRQAFVRRFGPMRKAVESVKVSSFPVIAQALADEVRYGYRTPREAERLAGALIVLGGGAAEAYPRRTRYRRASELRDAGYVVAPDWLESVEVDLGGELEAALEEFGG